MEFLLIVLGLVSGALAGILGVGGGVIIVPALIYFFHFSQKTAQGTTLALLVPPIGILAAYAYYRAGHVDIKAAILIIFGFLAGSFLSAHFANNINEVYLTRIFGAFLLLVALKMLIKG
jgi:uncharacterized membrane protein YfcA